MTRLVAVETSGPICSVAVHVDGEWTEDTRNIRRMHNEVLLEQIDAVIGRAGLRPRQIDVAAFGAGPGSFTGVRMAAAAVQAIAFASAATVVPVRSSLALAAEALNAESAEGADGFITVTLSRRDAYYVAAYRRAGAALEPVLRDRLHQGHVAPPDLPRGRWIGVGDRPPWWAQAAPERFADGCHATALTIGRLALADVQRGAGVPAEQALPVYIAGDSPWIPGAPRPDVR
jgi:tRNA threonylcarbamoyladenosine biosynthesis protein TsaB